jgi:hypothetical protein
MPFRSLRLFLSDFLFEAGVFSQSNKKAGYPPASFHQKPAFPKKIYSLFGFPFPFRKVIAFP